jgi:hypothetical protein
MYSFLGNVSTNNKASTTTKITTMAEAKFESIEESLREQCGDAATLIALVRDSYEFNATTQGPNQGRRSISGDQHPIYTASTWEPLIKKIITARATHDTFLYKDVEAKETAYVLECSRILQENFENVKSKACSDDLVQHAIWNLFGSWLSGEMDRAWGVKQNFHSW